ncbi:uncharacterized protein [Salminus brasiliensis]|uniref:uncharacterized protein n=1 Tax=Salminus brasiliensis TaxID=930266 RepID=UPI003B83109B
MLNPLYQPQSGCRGYVLLQCSLAFEQQPSCFLSERAKVAYIISLLTGRALAWATPVWEYQRRKARGARASRALRGPPAVSGSLQRLEEPLGSRAQTMQLEHTRLPRQGLEARMCEVSSIPHHDGVFDTDAFDITTLSPNNSTTGAITTDMPTDASFDPCYNYTALDNNWRSIYTPMYSGPRGYDDTLVEWKGWYRLYVQGQSAQMSEWCLYHVTCGGYTPLTLNGSHPQIGDGIVTRGVIGSCALQLSCNYYPSNPIKVKACPGNYYVYKLVKPDLSIPRPSYCAVSFSNSSADPCYNYTVLNDPWRSTNSAATTTRCDTSVNWVGWYRLFYQGQSAKMPESCVSSNFCGTTSPLWLSGSHPRLEDGVVVRPICGSYSNLCCYFHSSPIRVKACPGDYYVYEFIQPNFCNGAYCIVSFSNSSTDPCYNYTVLNDPWRSTNSAATTTRCDTSVNWVGWYRLFYQGQSAKMPESCVSSNFCGTTSPLWLSGSHPRLEDGVVVRPICGSYSNLCCYFHSSPIRVKACPGDYYVYEFIQPNFCNGAYCIGKQCHLPVSSSVQAVVSVTAPRQAVPTAPVPVKAVPTAPVSVKAVTTAPVPVNTMPTAPVPVKAMPTAPVPVKAVPTAPVPVNTMPTAPVPVKAMPTAPVPVKAMPTAPVPVMTMPTAPVPVTAVLTAPEMTVPKAPAPVMVAAAVSVSDTPAPSSYAPDSVPAPRPLMSRLMPRSLSSALCAFLASSFCRLQGVWFYAPRKSDPCEALNCTKDEWCGQKNHIYGCFCNQNHNGSNSEIYDSREICESSSGTLSLSRCQLFEAGFTPGKIHLNDPSCRGTIRNGRLEFRFDNDDHICGTNLWANGTHFMYENSLQVDSTVGPIIRGRHLNLSFSCVYSLTQTVSMDINPLMRIIHKNLPSGQGMYRVRMIPYQDSGFFKPFSGKLTVELDQQLYVSVEVEGVDSRQIALLIDTCWTTPVYDPNYHLRWDLITRECPDPKDNTVQVLQNGNSTISRFSFAMFAFSEDASKVFLHCSIHLCLLQGNDCTAQCNPGSHRKSRSVDFHDSLSLSVGPLFQS